MPIRNLLFLIVILVLSSAAIPALSCFTAIFSFGDSIADTGNLLASVSGNSQSGKLPYGETYFHHPAGRFSDGRLVVDFIAQAVGVPLLPPYLAGNQNFSQGVNFAVGGGNALSNEFFTEKGLQVNWTDYSFATQLQWFKQVLPLICSSELECDNIMSNSLFLAGEIGGNDYNYPIWQGRNFDEIRTYVPAVIDAITSSINVLIEHGARTLLVPGNFPIGCVPSFLSSYQSENMDDYDPKTGCIKWLNEFSEYHNQQLKDGLSKLRLRHPHATIIYADYYEATMSIYNAPLQFGFGKHVLNACCGGHGPYNIKADVGCGGEGSILCNDPSKYVSWDGLHFTEAAYKIIADGVIKGPYALPSIEKLCYDKASL